MKEVIPSLLKLMKWFKRKQNVQVEDVVLVRDEMAARQTHKYSRIVKVHSGTDRMVQSTDIKYKFCLGRKCLNNYPAHPQTDNGGSY